MKKQYTKRQITEAIAYWKNVLAEGKFLNESGEDEQKALYLLKNIVYDIESKEDLLKSDAYKSAVELLKKLKIYVSAN